MTFAASNPPPANMMTGGIAGAGPKWDEKRDGFNILGDSWQRDSS